MSNSLPLDEPDPAGLYIHIPYCRTKCQYCSFLSYPCHIGEPDYLDALTRRMRDMAGYPWFKKRRFASIFIGGGTPTIYDGASLVLLLNACFDNFKFIDQPEVSIESNPNTISLAKLQQCHDAGVNRLSIGVQAFDDRLLSILGRSHSAQDAIKAVSAARQAGFDNINLDLMYGLPGQKVTDWQETLKSAISLAPEHLSMYQLSVDEGTPFAELHRQNRLSLPDDDKIIEMEDFTYTFVDKHGYIRYEISNFGKKGYFCRHNINYWRNGSYLGLGAGAVSCFSGLRLTNTDDLALYMEMADKGQDAFADGEALSNEASFRESVIMGLRMLRGVSLSELRCRYGIDPREYYGERLRLFLEQDLIYLDDDCLRLTTKALPVANQILSELV